MMLVVSSGEVRTTVCRPFRSPVPLSETGPLSRADGPVMCAMAPLTSGARTVGSLALLMDPLGRFSELLSVARTGDHGRDLRVRPRWNADFAEPF